jgi:hypothetical protein
MTVTFSVVRLEDELSAGSSPGWAVVQHETGQPNRFVSRIFLREQDAEVHAHRMTVQAVSKARNDAGLSPLPVQSRFKT